MRKISTKKPGLSHYVATVIALTLMGLVGQPHKESGTSPVKIQLPAVNVNVKSNIDVNVSVNQEPASHKASKPK